MSESFDRDELQLLRTLDTGAGGSQRQLAEQSGFSLGKFNYVLKKAVGKGLVKLENFRKSNNKAGYRYLLTPEGASAKARLTKQYLQIKMHEYDELQREIAELQRETAEQDADQLAR